MFPIVLLHLLKQDFSTCSLEDWLVSICQSKLAAVKRAIPARPFLIRGHRNENYFLHVQLCYRPFKIIPIAMSNNGHLKLRRVYLICRLIQLSSIINKHTRQYNQPSRPNDSMPFAIVTSQASEHPCPKHTNLGLILCFKIIVTQLIHNRWSRNTNRGKHFLSSSP